MYIVFYTEGCSPKIKEFKSLSAAQKFADKHDLNREGQKYTDDWSDCIVEGRIVKTYPSWYGKQVKE